MIAQTPVKSLTVAAALLVVTLVVVVMSGCGWFSPPVPPAATDLVIKKIGMLAPEIDLVDGGFTDMGASEFADLAGYYPNRAHEFTDIALGIWTSDMPATFDNGEYTITWDTSFESFIWEFTHKDDGGFLVTIVAAQTVGGWAMVIQKDNVDFVRAAISTDGTAGVAVFSSDDGEFYLEWGVPGDAGYPSFYDVIFSGHDEEPIYELYIDSALDGSTGSFNFTNHAWPDDNDSGAWP